MLCEYYCGIAQVKNYCDTFQNYEFWYFLYLISYVRMFLLPEHCGGR